MCSGFFRRILPCTNNDVPEEEFACTDICFEYTCKDMNQKGWLKYMQRTREKSLERLVDADRAEKLHENYIGDEQTFDVPDLERSQKTCMERTMERFSCGCRGIRECVCFRRTRYYVPTEPELTEENTPDPPRPKPHTGKLYKDQLFNLGPLSRLTSRTVVIEDSEFGTFQTHKFLSNIGAMTHVLEIDLPADPLESPSYPPANNIQGYILQKTWASLVSIQQKQACMVILAKRGVEDMYNLTHIYRKVLCDLDLIEREMLTPNYNWQYRNVKRIFRVRSQFKQLFSVVAPSEIMKEIHDLKTKAAAADWSRRKATKEWEPKSEGQDGHIFVDFASEVYPVTQTFVAVENCVILEKMSSTSSDLIDSLYQKWIFGMNFPERN